MENKNKETLSTLWCDWAHLGTLHHLESSYQLQKSVFSHPNTDF